MAVKKRVSRTSRRTTSKTRTVGRKFAGAAKSAGSSRIARLEATVNKLRASLIAETRRRKLDQRLAAEASKARAAIAREMSALRAQGAKLARQISRAMHQNRTLEQARKTALAKAEELRAKLHEKGDELRSTSAELARLVRESAHRARDIVHAHGVVAAEPAREEAPAPPPAPQPTTDQITGEKPPA
jgi:predicted nuclease with TOPRIM domain